MANVLVVGDGAIGLLYSHYLAQYHTVTVLAKHAQSTERYYQCNSNPKQKINCTVSHFSMLKPASIETIIVAVKAHQVLSAFSQVKSFLSHHCNIVLSHNGMGNVDEISAQLNEQQGLFFLTTQQAGFKCAHDTVRHTGKGKSVLGPCNNQALARQTTVLKALNAIPNIQLSNDINTLRWQKLLINVAINPLTALNNIPNGNLRAPHYSRQIMNLLAEACQVAAAEKVAISLPTALAQAYNVMTLTAKNYSSMHQDLAHKRQTEIESICGFLVKKAQHHQLQATENAKLLQKINDATDSKIHSAF